MQAFQKTDVVLAKAQPDVSFVAYSLRVPELGEVMSVFILTLRWRFQLKP